MPSSIDCGYCLYQNGMQLSALLQRMYDAGPSFTDAGTAAALQPAGGVVPAMYAHLKVTAPTSGMTVNVAPGYVVLPSSTSGEGAYYFGLMSAGVLTVPANTTGSARQDYVIAWVNDLGNSSSASYIQYVTGTAAPPSLAPYPNSVILAALTVPNSATNIVSGDITDQRTFTVAPGGILPIPDAADAPAGPSSLLLWDIATSQLMQATTTAGAPVAYSPTASVTTASQQLVVTSGSSGHWVCPPGVFTAYLQGWGAGGGGGDGLAGNGPGGGGGGGAFGAITLTTVPGTSYPWAVPYGGTDGDAGGDFTFGTSGDLLTVAGGQPGTSGEFTSGGGQGGQGGAAPDAPIAYAGGSGGSPDNGSAAGGSSAGPSAAGNPGADGTDQFTASTTPPPGGGPGAPGVASGDAGSSPLSGPGGGGSGGTADDSTPGGPGWAGQMILSWDAPADSAGFAYQEAGTIWQAFSTRWPYVLAQVQFTAGGTEDWEFTCHAAQVSTALSAGAVQCYLYIDGSQADQIRVHSPATPYPYASMPAGAPMGDWTWITSSSQATTPSAGTHTAEFVVHGANGGEAIVASPWWLRAGVAGSS
jgi:hypothetical protein